MNPGSADQVLVDTFEEVALVLGGIFAVHEVMSVRHDVFIEPGCLIACYGTVGSVNDDHRPRVGSFDDADHCAESLTVLEAGYRIDEFGHHGAM